MSPVFISRKDRILIIAPHPDDEIIGVGGMLLSYTSQCDIIVLTDGAIGQRDLPPAQEREKRRIEFLQEMQALKIPSSHYWLLDYPDGQLNLFLNCLDKRDLSKYTKIFVTAESDHHIDHTAAFHALLRAVNQRHVDGTEIYCYEVHNPLQEPTHYLDITSKIQRKIELIRYHRSQIKDLPYDEYAETMARYRALQQRMPGKSIEVYTKLSGVRKNILQADYIQEETLQKFKMFYSLLTTWMLLPDGEDGLQFLEEKNIGECVVYGFAELGKILYQRLMRRGISVKCIIDMKLAGGHTEDGIPIVVLPSEQVPKHMMVIVTAIFSFEDIKNMLHESGYDNVVSLNRLIEECQK